MKKYDSIIIGAGPNGLVTAAYLAKGGQRTLVLEKRPVVGGIATTEELFPGFRFNICTDYLRWLQPQVAKDLRLADHGLAISWANPMTLAPLVNGGHLALWRNEERTENSIRHFSQNDAKNWQDFLTKVCNLTKFLKAVYSITPPSVPDVSLADLRTLFKLARPIQKVGRKSLIELLRTLPMTMPEFLDEWFESDVLRGTLAASGVSGLFQGPMAVGTAYLFLHHHIGAAKGIIRPAGVVRGGIGGLTDALARSARQHNVEIRTDSKVLGIGADERGAYGVTLSNGEEIEGRQIISGLDPYKTFMDLIGPQKLEPKFVREIRNIKFRGALARIHLALEKLPIFTSLPNDTSTHGGTISISPSLEYLERAYDDAKYGAFSKEPYLEVSIPSLADPTLAPEGKHVMSISVQYVPYRLKSGNWTETEKERLARAVVSTLEEYAPGFGNLVEHQKVLAPLDLEEMFGLTEGNLNHGEMMLDQFFFMRPVPSCAQYRTPVRNLYLCGSGTHPGGGVTCAPGRNAAGVILSDS